MFRTASLVGREAHTAIVFLSGLRVKLREKKRLELREREAKRSGPLNAGCSNIHWAA
jgi:hypothetical protein